MDDNKLMVLEGGRISWQYSELQIVTHGHNLKDCLHVVFNSFMDKSGKEAEHIWMSYNRRGVMVSFNARTREQRHTLNCDDYEQLKTGELCIWWGSHQLCMLFT